jgi:beta-lactamase regulating signal transducer with metallopeptidase domain
MFLDSLLSNAVLATVLAAIVLVATRIWRRPPLVYWLWLLVLVKLVTPGVYSLPIGVAFHEESAVRETNAIKNTATTVSVDDKQLATEVAPGATPANSQAADLRESLDTLAGLMSVETTADPALRLEFFNGDVVMPAAPSLSWRPVVAGVWIAGSGLWIALALVRILRFHRLAALARPAPEWLQIEAQHIADRYGLRRSPPIRMVRAKVPPLVWAIHARPVVLLPSQLISNLSRDQLVALLAHELAHVRRGDHWVRRLELVVLAVYWWHPAAWLARRQLQEAEELCCDAWVTWSRPDSSRSYADAIVQTVEFLAAAHGRMPIAASRMTPVRLLERRIQMILAGRSQRRLSWISGLVVLAVGLVALPWSTRADEATPVAGLEKIDSASDNKTADDRAASSEVLIEPAAQEQIPRERSIQVVALQDVAGEQPAAAGPGYTDIFPTATSAQPTPAEQPAPARRARPQRVDPSRPNSDAVQHASNTASGIKVFSLQNADADSMAQILKSLFREGLPVAADRRTNSVIVIGMPEPLMMIEAIVTQLDKAGTRMPPKAVQIQKLPDQNVLIVRGREENVKGAVDALDLDARPSSKPAKEDPTQLPAENLQAVIRRQQQEIKELRATLEQVMQQAKRLEMENMAKELMKQKQEAAREKNEAAGSARPDDNLNR